MRENTILLRNVFTAESFKLGTPRCVAQCINRLDRDALAERNAAIPDEELANMASGRQRWAWRLNTLLALTENTQDRLNGVIAAWELRATAAKDGKRKKRVAGT